MASLDPVIELIDADVPRSDGSGPPIVRHVDWTVDRGSFWALGAFAGAGKTDLLLTASGLVRPAAGDLRLFGHTLADMPEDELVRNRLKVAMVFTNGRLFAHMTLAENIALPLRYHHGEAAPNVIAQALDQTGLSAMSERLPRQIPRALHQRVALARALALCPEVILVDNPLVGGDQRNARWWIDFLCAAHTGDAKLGRQLTVIIATDDLRPWSDTAHQFAVLRERRFQVIGGREELRQSSENTVRDLLAGAFDTI